MSIKRVILGFLSETPLTGYDLKKKFSSSDIFHWSGNSNQIYRALIELHNEQHVTLELQTQEGKPPRKLYHITETGLNALRQWLQSPPELPQFHHTLLMQLTWADRLNPDALQTLLTEYAEDLEMQIVMLREKALRDSKKTMKSTGIPFAARVAEHWIAFYELELNWVRDLRQELADDSKD